MQGRPWAFHSALGLLVSIVPLGMPASGRAEAADRGPRPQVIYPDRTDTIQPLRDRPQHFVGRPKRYLEPGALPGRQGSSVRRGDAVVQKEVGTGIPSLGVGFDGINN